MSFAGDLDKFSAKLEKRGRAIFLGSSTEVKRSITDGSAVTGAPGQPVQIGHLKRSWQLTFPAAWRSRIATKVAYAPPIELGVGQFGPLTLRSSVGGFHSVALTRAGWGRIVAFQNRKFGGTG